MKTIQIALLVMALLAVISVGYAINEMPIMQTFVGRSGNSWFGEKLIAMDFNADSYDDIIVHSRNADNGWPGMMLYYGSAQIDTIPDAILTGSFCGQVSVDVLLNAGDVNRDGYDDLLTIKRFAISEEDSVALNFFYGGPNADLEPDHEIIVEAFNGYPRIRPLSCIGDVNNDGYDDLGCSVWAHDEYDGEYKLAILFGGTWNLLVLENIISSMLGHDIEPVGDVNGDGLDDFVTGFGADYNGEFNIYRYLYLGSNTFDIDDRILMYEVPYANAGGQTFAAAYGIGDFNADGYDDMVYCNGDSWYDNNKIRLGGSDILNTQEFTVQSYQVANLLELGTWQKIAYGDFNGDGFSDLAGSDWGAFTWIGHAGIWLGKADPNGQYDLRISSPPSSPFHQFGWQLAAGDFNGDGYCDLAVSAPQANGSGNPWYNGYVYIFAGNAQLADTTVANDDPIVPEQVPLRMRYYPNPHSGDYGSISYEVEGKLPSHTEQVYLTIHNIKGQLVKRTDVDIDQLRKGKGSLAIPKLSSGIYIMSLWLNGTKTRSDKIVIK